MTSVPSVVLLAKTPCSKGVRDGEGDCYTTITRYSQQHTFHKDALDIHTLVIPKEHIPKLSDLPPDLASAVGEAVSKVTNALTGGALVSFFILEIYLLSKDSLQSDG